MQIHPKSDLLWESRPSTLKRALDNTRVETSSMQAGKRGTGQATSLEDYGQKTRDPHLPVMKQELLKASKSSKAGYELVTAFKSHRDVPIKSQAMVVTMC